MNKLLLLCFRRLFLICFCLLAVLSISGLADPDKIAGNTPFAGFNKPAQGITLDWKIHDVGKIRQVVTNIGGINAYTGHYAPLFNYPYLFNSEYVPTGSTVKEEHIFESGLRIGALVGGDTLMSITNWNNQHQFYEFWPTAAEYDSIWEVLQGDTVDIPYWPGYVGISDQDFICRYSDYNLTNISLHTPLYVDVIQTSHAWANFPLDKVIVYQYYIVPTRFDLNQAYISYMLQGNVGDFQSGGFATDDDDVAGYIPAHNMGIIEDLPGGTDGTALSQIAMKVFPPDGYSGTLYWTFNWYDHHHNTPMRDQLAYDQQMVKHTIMQNQVVGGQSIFCISFGPFNLAVGDTLHFRVAEIIEEGIDEIMNAAETLDRLVAQGFKLPKAPPQPPLRAEIRSHEISLDWRPQPGANPEDYTDPNRSDGIEKPFEGYRVYKSTQGITGPWTLLAEYDLINDIGFNTGIPPDYRINDTGLLDYVDYFYSITAYSRADTVLPWPSLESSINNNAIQVTPGPDPRPKVGEVSVVPNPYRGDINYNAFDPSWEKNPPGRQWMEQDRRILFINLPEECEIKIYTLAGDLVDTIAHSNPVAGFEGWNLTSSIGQAVSSGIYLFTVKDHRNGEVQVGKFVILK